MVGAGPELGLIFQRLFLSFSPKSTLDFAVPPPSTVVPVFVLLCIAALGYALALCLPCLFSHVCPSGPVHSTQWWDSGEQMDF